MNDLLLLAMMLDGPKYGYQLKREAGWMMRQESLHNNIVYPMLRSFLEKGWVSKKNVPGDRGQTRQQYALTADGRRAFFERMNAFSDDDAAHAEAFYLRIGVFAALQPEDRVAILGRRDHYLAQRDQRLDTLQSNMDVGRFGGEIIRHLRKQIQIEREWIRHLGRFSKSKVLSKQV